MTTLREAVAHLYPIDRSAVLYAVRVVNDDDYRTWVRVGITLHTLTQGSEFGRDLFAGWAKQSPKYLDESNQNFWNDSWWRAGHLFNLCHEMEHPRKPTCLDAFDHTHATRH